MNDVLKKWTSQKCFFILFVTSLLISYQNFQQREYGWDMPGYIGSYLLAENSVAKEQIREKVYSVIKSEAPAFQYDKMVGFHQEGSWNDYISKNSEAFNLQIPYYSIKVFYVFLIFCFHHLGFSLPTAVFLPNIVSFFIFSFLLYYIFKEIIKDKLLLALILTLIIILLPPFRYLASIPSPDMLAVLLLSWFAYAVVKKYRFYVQFMILMLAIFTRPDLIIFALTYLVAFFLFDFYRKRKINWFSVGYLIVMLGTYLLILNINHYPGWKDVFYDTFIHRRKMITGNADFTFQEYWQIVVKNLVNFKKITCIAAVFLLTVFYISKDVWIKSLAAFIFLNIYLKFAFFPAPGEYRFFIGFLLLLFMVALYVTKDKIRNFPFQLKQKYPRKINR